jgi:hypothetical protein
MPPASWFNEIPYRLDDITVFGAVDNFRMMVWRSLCAHVNNILKYEYLDAHRLVEIYLGQDPDYARIRDLEDLDLVVLLIGVSDPPNKMLPSLCAQLITGRRQLGKPTWIYTPFLTDRFRSIYGPELAELLGIPRVTVRDLANTRPEAPPAIDSIDPTAI